MVSLLVIAPSLLGFRDNEVVPVWTDAPASLAASQNGTVTVGFDRTATSDTTVSISTSAPTDLTVPSTVTLLSGQNQVQFQVTMNSNATNGGTVSAACNGSSAQSLAIALN